MTPQDGRAPGSGPGRPGEAALLGIADRPALLAFTRNSRTADGLAFEFSHDFSRADRTFVTFRTVKPG